MFWSLEANCECWSHSPQWFCVSLILRWDLSCFASRKRKSTLNLEKKGVRGGPCTVGHCSSISKNLAEGVCVWPRWQREQLARTKRLWAEGCKLRGSSELWNSDFGLKKLLAAWAGWALQVRMLSWTTSTTEIQVNTFLARFEGAIPELAKIFYHIPRGRVSYC